MALTMMDSVQMGRLGTHANTTLLNATPRVAATTDLHRYSHELDRRVVFSDRGLAAILDAYPRERLGIYRFPTHGEGVTRAAHGRSDLPGEELLNAVKTGRIWLNLRGLNHVLPAFAEITGDVFGDIAGRLGRRTLKHDLGLLISSPNIEVHYHLDIPRVSLLQLRGTKTLRVYPPRAPFVTPEQLEAIARRDQDEELEFRTAFDAHAVTIDMHPGDAVSWPQFAPHRVVNGPEMNVSLSCEFMTPGALIGANIAHANGLLRRLGFSPALPGGAFDGPKAVLAQIDKRIFEKPKSAPTPLTFDVTCHGITPYEAPFTRSVHPSELTPAEIAGWKALRTRTGETSPLLAPAFAQLVGTLRPDVRLILRGSSDRLDAVMGVEGHRPLGAPFADYSGLLGDADPAELLADVGLPAFRSLSSIVPGPGADGGDELTSLIVDTGGMSGPDYLEARRAAHPKRFKNFRRLRAKIERELGPVTLNYGPADSDRYATLLDWKSAQLTTDGLVDLTRTPRSRELLDAVAASPLGYLVALEAGGRMLAAHFGIREGAHFHPWISAFDPHTVAYSPGLVMMHDILSAMDGMGLRSYDLSSGHAHYKKYFASKTRTVHTLDIRTRLSARLSGRAWKILGAGTGTGTGVTARLRRRLDQIAACEPRSGARMNEFVTAIRLRR